MKSAEFKNRIWIYSSILFMGSLLIVTLTVIGFYGYKVKGLGKGLISPNGVIGNIKADVEIAKRDRDIKDLQSKNTALQKEVSSLKGKPGGNIDAYINLIKADEYFKEGSYEASLNILNTYNESNFQDIAKDKYIALKEKANVKAASTLYGNGITAYNKGDYKTAADTLSKAVQYGPSQTFADRAAYYVALSYKALGDTTNEKKYLEMVINNYPKSKYSSSAKREYDIL